MRSHLEATLELEELDRAELSADENTETEAKPQKHNNRRRAMRHSPQALQRNPSAISFDPSDPSRYLNINQSSVSDPHLDFSDSGSESTIGVDGRVNACSTAIQHDLGSNPPPRQPSDSSSSPCRGRSQFSSASRAAERTGTAHIARTQSSTRSTSVTNTARSQPSLGGGRDWNWILVKATAALALLAFLTALVFGVGAWVGMNYANNYAAKGYQLSLWGTCHDHDDIKDTPVCREILTSGIHPPNMIKRDGSRLDHLLEPLPFQHMLSKFQQDVAYIFKPSLKLLIRDILMLSSLLTFGVANFLTAESNATVSEPGSQVQGVPSMVTHLTLAATIILVFLYIFSALVRRSSGPMFTCPWNITIPTVVISVLGITCLVAILNSAAMQQHGELKCRMPDMRPSYVKLEDFNTEHTRYANKYSLYLHREQGICNSTKLQGIPVLFIPGDAGSYKQVRSIGAETANYFHDVLKQDKAALRRGVRSLDFFTVDFDNDVALLQGPTLLEQAEYVNTAIRYILSLYVDPRMSERDPGLPDPTSIIILGHSLGGIVARTLVVLPNYKPNSINTIVTISAPHSRPPMTFNREIIKIYKEINDYWRAAYSQRRVINNPLRNITLISVTGGGSDMLSPPYYANLESIVPYTHGLTVFTSAIPNLWTSMNHQTILWCDQFRKVIAQALYEVVDVNRATQTIPRARRISVFKKRFLTGMEDIAEDTLHSKRASTFLTFENSSHAIVPLGERLVLRDFGNDEKPRAHLLPIHPFESPETKRLMLLTDQRLQSVGEKGNLEVLLCNVYPQQPDQDRALPPTMISLSGDNRPTQLRCTNAASDAVQLPASPRSTRSPFAPSDEMERSTFSYLQYDVARISDHQFIAIVDNNTKPSSGFVIAEFSNHSEYHQSGQIGLRSLLTSGTMFQLPVTRRVVTEINIPSLPPSPLAYKLEIRTQTCGEQDELFTPLVRQFSIEPYESKYFLNASHAKLDLNGVVPHIPIQNGKTMESGLTFQLWMDPTCDSMVFLSLGFDILGSLVKLYMRYQTTFLIFPFCVVGLVIQQQFRYYNRTGVFISFNAGLDTCLRTSIPLVLTSLALMSLSMRISGSTGIANFWHWADATGTMENSHQTDGNNLFTVIEEPFAWFMIPLIGVICVGVCAVLNYVLLTLPPLLSLIHNWLSVWSDRLPHNEHPRGHSLGFVPFSPTNYKMIIFLLWLVLPSMPYELVYLVACLVQLTTIVRAHRIASKIRSNITCNFYNYVHSVFILMLSVLPVNFPILVLWMQNLTLDLFTPFPSHRSSMSIVLFGFLVETLAAGEMAPRVTSGWRHFTNLVFFGVSIYAALYGTSFAYILPSLVNLAASLLFLVHLTSKISVSIR